MSFAEVVLRGDGRDVHLGRLAAGDLCTLGFLDALLQLQVALGRFGWSVVLIEVPDELQELVDLVGLDRDLRPWPAEDRAGPPEGG